MTGTGPSGQLPPFDGTPGWLELLPILLEQVARLLLDSASPQRTAPAGPEVLTAELQWADADVTEEQVIECLLLLEQLGFLQLLTVHRDELAILAPATRDLLRNIPETHGQGARERAGAGEGARAGERASASGPPRPAGARRKPQRRRFCPEHWPGGTGDDCGMCARVREMEAARGEQARRVFLERYGSLEDWLDADDEEDDLDR